MYAKTIAAACAPLLSLLVGCTAPADPAEISSEVTSAVEVPAGHYTRTELPPGFRWINELNLHADGTFEASFGNGASELSGHAFLADGTYRVDARAATIRFSYAFVSDEVDTYRVRSSAGGVELRFVNADEQENYSWFTLRRGPRPISITFGADWSVTQSGPLVAGAPLLVEYAAARAVCPQVATASSLAITLLGRVDGNTTQYAVATAFPAAPAGGHYRALGVVPAGHTLALWLDVSAVDAQQQALCHGWDSHFGDNFNFPIAAP